MSTGSLPPVDPCCRTSGTGTSEPRALCRRRVWDTGVGPEIKMRIVLIEYLVAALGDPHHPLNPCPRSPRTLLVHGCQHRQSPDCPCRRGTRRFDIVARIVPEPFPRFKPRQIGRSATHVTSPPVATDAVQEVPSVFKIDADVLMRIVAVIFAAFIAAPRDTPSNHRDVVSDQHH